MLGWYRRDRPVNRGVYAFFARALSRLRFSLASSFRSASFEIVMTLRKALSNRSQSVLPGTSGAGCGFIWSDYNAVFGLSVTSMAYPNSETAKKVNRKEQKE